MDGRPHPLAQVSRLLLGLVVLSALMGLLLAGIAIPAVGAGGTIANSSVKAFNDLPSEFTISPLAEQSRIVDARGGLIANPYDENRIVVPLKKISPWMRKAQIAIEDSRFYEHGGMDVRGFTRAFVSNLSGRDTQGASTITQQYVKVTLQDNALRRGDKAAAEAATAQTYTRKLQELKYALDVERNFTKDQILQGYLNLVYYGDQAYGVEAAAQNYFGISASKLSLVQAATLAGIVQQPNAYNPVLHPKASQQRRNVVLDRMRDLGMASAAEVKKAKATSIKTTIKRKPPQGVCQRSSEPYFCAYVMEYIQNSPQMAVLGKTPAERLKNINQSGLTVQTTLDPALQKSAARELTKAVPIGSEKSNNVAGASTVIEPGTGRVLAAVQSTSFKDTELNLNVDQRYGGGPFGYQIGSTAKAYALLTALENGWGVESSIDAPFADTRRAHYFPTSGMHDACAASKDWEVFNDYPVGGWMSLRKATAQSINTAFGELVIELGGCKVWDDMNKVGLHMSNGKPIDKTIASITLGAGEANPMTMAASYATFAARGKHCEPSPIASITASDGKKIAFPAPACKQVIRPEIADGVTELLRGPLQSGTATNAQLDRPAAGKTGTTNNHNQSWFVGYTPQRSTAVWIGNLKKNYDGTDSLRTLNGKCFGEYGCQGQVFGGTVAAPVWKKIMQAAVEGLPSKSFTYPASSVLYGKNGQRQAPPAYVPQAPAQQRTWQPNPYRRPSATPSTPAPSPKATRPAPKPKATPQPRPTKPPKKPKIVFPTPSF